MVATPSRRDEGETALAGVTDPRAVPSIGRVFATTSSQERRAVRLLGQIDAPRSTCALAYLAVFARTAEARRAATETLRNRDPREFADLLIALLDDPIRFEVKHVDGPTSPGELLVEGKRVNVRRLYMPPPVFRPGDQLGFDALGRAVVFRQVEPGLGSIQPGGAVDAGTTPIASMSPAEVRQALPIMQESLASNPVRATTKFTFQLGNMATIPLGQMVSEAQKSSEATERQLREDARMLEDHNVAVRVANDRVVGVLNDATRQSLPAERGAWTKWWVDQIGYASSSSSDWTSKSSVVENVSIAYQPPAVPEGAARQILDYGRRSCFGAGTPVRTIAGPRAIETLQVGDRVLTQDTTTGRLGYRPILTVHRNPPSPTFRIKLQGEPIVASPFHRFWVAGQGWVMARDLRAGDPIRTLGGVAPVESIEADAVQLVYNLDVADDADFFAGNVTALVHDNTLPDPRLAPFDASKGR
jgi:Pretoxin HINT domain